MMAQDGSELLTYKHIFGLKADVSRLVHYVEETIIMYPCGHNVVLYNSDTREQELIHGMLQTPVKSEGITALGITPNRKFLAVAERADRAIVSIYDATTQRRRRMLQYPEIGSKEIVCISFSADSKFCLTQGGAPEWQLVLWTFDRSAKPIATFKTSTQSGPPIYQADFGPQVSQTYQQAIIFSAQDSTVMCASGDGTLKFLRVTENQLKPIQYNLKREPQNYLCHCWLQEDRLVVATDCGDLLVFEGFEFRTTLTRPAQVPAGNAVFESASNRSLNSNSSGQEDLNGANTQVRRQRFLINPGGSINSIVAFSKGFVCGCADGILCVFERADDARDFYKCSRAFNIQGNESPITNLALSPSEEMLCCTTHNCQMYTFTLSNTDILKDDTSSFELLSTSFHEPGPSGSAKITAIDVCVWKPILATCGEDQTLRIWNYHERRVDLIKNFDEDILSVALHPSGLLAVVGFSDKIRLVSLLMDDILTVRELPIMKGCNECSFAHGGHLFAVANISVLQIVNTYTFEMTANLRGHNGMVKAIRWAKNDRKIMTAGSDGIVIVWRIHEGSKDTEHVIPRLSYQDAVSSFDFTRIFTVANDESIRELNPSDQATCKSKACGTAPTCIEISATQRLLFIGCAGGKEYAPGVIQVHAMRDIWESTEPKVYQCASLEISCLKLSTDGSLLFAGGADGSLCMFEVHDIDQRGVARPGARSNPQQQDVTGTSAAGSTPANAAGQTERYVEEILVTKSDIEAKSSAMRKLRDKVVELTLNNDYQLRLKDMKFKGRIAEITEKFSSELQTDSHRCEQLSNEKRKMEEMYEEKFRSLDERHKSEFQELERTYEAKINLEISRYRLLVSQREAQSEQWEEENRELIDRHAHAIKEVTTEYDEKIESEHELQKKLAEEKEHLVATFDNTKKLIEEDADIEALDVKQKYEAKLAAERELTKGLKDENGHMKKRHSALAKDVDDQKEEIRTLHDKEKELTETIKGLEKDIQGHKKEIREREETISDKEKRIYDLKKKNQELEKFKFVLDYKIKELKRQIEPRETEIADMRKQVEEMDIELDQYHKSNSALDLMIGELRLKMDGMQKELDQQKRLLRDADSYIFRFRRDLAECAAFLPDKHKKLKARVRDLYYIHILKDAPQMTSATRGNRAEALDLQAECNRQREHLERNIDALKRKIARDMKMYGEDRARLLDESTVLVNEMNNLRRQNHSLTLKQNTIRNQMAVLGRDSSISNEAYDTQLRALESRAKVLTDLLHNVNQGKACAISAEPNIEPAHQ